MSHLKTIDTIKALKGKLNFLKLPHQPFLNILHYANSLAPASSSTLGNTDLDEI